MRTPTGAWSRWIVPAVVLFSCVGCDQWTKRMATENLDPAAPIHLLGGTLRIQYAENPGAFLGAGGGLSQEARFWILVVVNAGFLVAIASIVLFKRNFRGTQIVAIALLLAGGIGNLIDRVFHNGLVVDFLNVGIGPLRTGIFNVADMAIMAGFALLIVQRSPADATDGSVAAISSPDTLAPSDLPLNT